MAFGRTTNILYLITCLLSGTGWHCLTVIHYTESDDALVAYERLHGSALL